jgi:hypothetical protein
MSDIKHIGRFKDTGRKVVVAYRTLPAESDYALVVQTEHLAPEQHDALITLVESNSGQNAYEFAEALARSRFPDGSVMLNSLHQTGRLSKVRTSDILMTPNLQASIDLAQLNQIIAEQRGVSVNDLALGNSTNTTTISSREVGTVNEVPPPKSEPVTYVEDAVTVNDDPLSDEDLAKKFRSDADRLSKEAAELRRQAEALVPTKKKVAAKVE